MQNNFFSLCSLEPTASPSISRQPVTQFIYFYAFFSLLIWTTRVHVFIHAAELYPPRRISLSLCSDRAEFNIFCVRHVFAEYICIRFCAEVVFAGWRGCRFRFHFHFHSNSASMLSSCTLFWWWNILGLASLGISARRFVLCGLTLILSSGSQISYLLRTNSHTHITSHHIRHILTYATRIELRVIYIQCGTDMLVLQLFILRTTQKIEFIDVDVSLSL